MFKSDNKKRPSSEQCDRGVRLKKPFKRANRKDPGIELRRMRSHDQVLHSHGADSYKHSLTSSHPQNPRTTSGGYTPHLDGVLPDAASLLALLDNDVSNELLRQPHPWSDYREEASDEDLSLDDETVVPRICFGVVSCSGFSRRTELM
jgi:hypothetical protein